MPQQEQWAGMTQPPFGSHLLQLMLPFGRKAWVMPSVGVSRPGLRMEVREGETGKLR